MEKFKKDNNVNLSDFFYFDFPKTFFPQELYDKFDAVFKKVNSKAELYKQKYAQLIEYKKKLAKYNNEDAKYSAEEESIADIQEKIRILESEINGFLNEALGDFKNLFSKSGAKKDSAPSEDSDA